MWRCPPQARSVTLDELLTPSLAAWLQDAPEPQRYRTAAELDAVVDRWAGAGARVTTLGYSREGRAIRAVSFGSGARSLLAWGYPHPDEPLGAEALAWLGDALAAGRLADLEGWTAHLVLCADPDEVQRNAGFLHGPRTAEAFVRGCWRPQHIGREVDYGLELDWGPIVPLPCDLAGVITRCASPAECSRRCGPGGCRTRHLPHRPSPESAALAAAFDLFRPDVAATMHGISIGASYTFLLHRERGEVLDDLLAIPAAAGAGRYLGEPIDAGRRWRTREPDLIRERGLAHRMRTLTDGSYDPELVYYTPVSVATYLEAQGRGGQLVTPEAAQFRHPDFSDPSPAGDTETVLVSVEERRRGRYRVTRVRVDDGWVVAHQDRVGDDEPLRSPTRVTTPVTRGMLGVRALARRRRVLAAADEIWATLDGRPWLVGHPYLAERWATTVPGGYVHDRSMLIFRTRSDYRRPASVAQRAAFTWRWPLHTASLLGNLRTFLAVQDHDRPQIVEAIARVEALQDAELAELPAELLVEAPRGPALRCMLARVLRVMLARDAASP